ncbi:hypothetical protein [Priestia megaterium]|uniref:hypothetical protein n=1 Tax=Priestia megaterium TaxID=1404 RepID=UPI000D508078|nr:hypothetical protein [Priestia megaterium]PVE72523.1 hypothetical protein DC428_05495 [Priestia megaterium]PVE89312.1 hypothetical protein DC421_04395 [Priestia megaterium]PVE93002.1 hypothetical protein DC426_06050 [Priestia megaterium]PVF00520.1 hypothetical protein DC433_08600 [Priestia megaterium]RMA91042.1 hypothetical protein DEU44_3132 [Priestia megaterium]
MSKRNILVKLMFFLGSFSITIFGFILKQGLTAFLLSAAFIILAGFLMKTEGTKTGFKRT